LDRLQVDNRRRRRYLSHTASFSVTACSAV
jgi:hypothetical protein